MYFWLGGIQIFDLFCIFLTIRSQQNSSTAVLLTVRCSKSNGPLPDTTDFSTEILAKSCIRNKNPVQVSYCKEEGDRTNIACIRQPKTIQKVLLIEMDLDYIFCELNKVQKYPRFLMDKNYY